VYAPNVQDETALLLDSWVAQSEQSLKKVLPDGKIVRTIPKGWVLFNLSMFMFSVSGKVLCKYLMILLF